MSNSKWFIYKGKMSGKWVFYFFGDNDKVRILDGWVKVCEGKDYFHMVNTLKKLRVIWNTSSFTFGSKD